MKKLLSIILVFAMLAAFVPAVSAEAADAQPNFTMVYDISGDLDELKPTSLSTIDLTYTDNFYALGTAGWGLDGSFKIYGSGENTNLAMVKWYWSSVKVWVPMAGTYTLKVDYATGLAFSQRKMRVYWNTTNNRSNKIGEYTSPAGSYSQTETEEQQFTKLSPTPFTKTVTVSEPGYYYVAFEVDDSGSDKINDLTARASFASISLVSGDGNGNAIVLGGIDEAFELNTTDNKTKQLTATGYLSKTREAVDFKYISSNTDVATVNENGVVTAVGAGEATITATSKKDSDNVTVPLTTTVTVTDPDAYTVTYDIGGTMTKYGIKKGTTGLQMTQVKYPHTNGFFAYEGASHTMDGVQDGAEYQSSTGSIALNRSNGYLTFKIKVPYEGDYKLQVKHDRATRGGYVDVYIGDARKGSYDCYGTVAGYMGDSRTTVEDIAKEVKEDGTLGEEATFHLTAGEHIIKFANRPNTAYADAIRGSVGTFKLIKGGSDAVKPMHGYATVSRNGVPVTSLTTGENGLTANAAFYTTDAQPAATATAITSSNPAVLKVDENGVVTAVGAGTATINASIEYAGTTYNVVSSEITVADPAISSNTVSFYADANVDVPLTIEGIEYVQGNPDGTVGANKTVTLTAPTDIEGKTFRGWMRGSEDNGVWLSPEAEISVTLVSNTFLTAVYDVAVAENEATVEFWNWSGQYLGSKTVDKGMAFSEVSKPPVHDLTGYEYAGWSVRDDEIVSGLTRAVAQFKKIKDETTGVEKKYHVTIPAGVTGAVTGNFEFDTKITLESETEVYWLRDGKTVDYGTTYSFYVWDNTVITTSKDGNSAPKVILDKHDEYNTYMIEFDKGEADNMRILEAGILFGNDPKVNSFDSKAVASGRDLTHGQFTAVANTTNGGVTNAVGYIVYLDGGIARVLYAK